MTDNASQLQIALNECRGCQPECAVDDDGSFMISFSPKGGGMIAFDFTANGNVMVTRIDGADPTRSFALNLSDAT